ncbi:MAG: glycosyl transferase, group 1 family protein [uncultured bacterium]|nr:MAG: glycosyl transferase, group 1 family protein [uncultured bacterium]KKU26468.1 MAG: Glycosyl transferase, group 1 family protein [Microgenomates group bacterium GW2011_GWA2_46_16]
MKVLMLTPYLPYPLVSGGQIRTYNLLKHLSKHHDITLFALIKDPAERQYLSELKKYCRHIELFKRTKNPFVLRNILLAGFSPYPFVVTRNLPLGMKRAVQAELARSRYDLIHAETFYMMPNIPPTRVPIILAEQTIEYLGYQDYMKKANLLLRPILALDVMKIKYWERYFWRKADKLITMSEEDKNFIERELGESTSTSVVANGVDLEFFSGVKKRLSQNPTVLFVGTFKWLPNIEAVEEIVHKIWPLILERLPSAKLKIVGFSPTAKILAYGHDQTIEVLGGIDDIRDAFASSHILLAPIRSGKGTRYKVLEAMITGTPVVATTLAVEGLDLNNGEQVLIADTSLGLAKAAVRLLKDSALQVKLGRAGEAIVRRDYSWDIIAKNLDQVYQEFKS